MSLSCMYSSKTRKPHSVFKSIGPLQGHPNLATIQVPKPHEISLSYIFIVYIIIISWFNTQMARFTWPTWAYLGPVGPRQAPCWPHEPCFEGIVIIYKNWKRVLRVSSLYLCMAHHRMVLEHLQIQWWPLCPLQLCVRHWHFKNGIIKW